MMLYDAKFTRTQSCYMTCDPIVFFVLAVYFQKVTFVCVEERECVLMREKRWPDEYGKKEMNKDVSVWETGGGKVTYT